MPTNELEPEFFRDYARLTPAQRTQFKHAVRDFVDDMKANRTFRPSLRVRGVQSHAGVFEMTWEMPNGRATFAYGETHLPNEPHIIWRRVGGHEIFKRP
jgi:hypothetical protein